MAVMMASLTFMKLASLKSLVLSFAMRFSLDYLVCQLNSVNALRLATRLSILIADIIYLNKSL